MKHVPAILVLVLSICAIAQAQIVFIPDENLKSLLVASYDQDSDDEINVSEALAVEGIYFENTEVTNLRGLESFENLTSLSIVNSFGVDSINIVTDLSPLEGLVNLTTLHLINFSINDLSPIASLTNLDSLHVGAYVPGARISDIAVVRNFTQLRQLNVDRHQITDICPIKDLTSIQYLSFNNNLVSDISCLQNLGGLDFLEFNLNPISDISVLMNFPNLTHLGAGMLGPVDISVLTGLQDLQFIYLGANGLTDISALVGNTGVGEGDFLDIDWNLLDSGDCPEIEELQGRGLAQFVYNPQQTGDIFCGDPGPVVYIPDANLKAYLVDNFDQNGDGEIGFDEAATVPEVNSLQEFNVQDFTGLEAFIGLKTLIWENIDYNRTAPTSLEPLRALSGLQHLFLMGFGITDVEPLSNLEMLTYLFLIGVNNPDFSITDFESLTNLNNLIQLGLDSFPLLNNVTPVTSFASTLRFFNFSYNDRSTDLSAIGQLTDLEILHINEYDTTDYSFLHNLDHLWWLEVSGGGLWDLSPIANMTDLSILYISNCQIDNISPLISNSGLGPDDSLYMDFNYLDEDDCPDITLLESRGFKDIVYNPQRYGEICRNEPPVIITLPDGVSIEGGAYELATVTFTDPDEDDSHTATIDWGDGTIEVGVISESSGGGSVSGSHSYHDNGTFTVTVSVTDNSGLSATSFFEICVSNSAPILGTLGGPQDPTILGVAVTLTADFVDAGSLDTHTAQWTWGDGSISSGVVTEANGTGTAAGNHIYAQPGVYAIQLEVTDDDGGSASAIYEYIVVYDPEGASVTGGGWIDSLAGAYSADPVASGKLHFTFKAEYTKGAGRPSGKTQIKLKEAGLDLRSTNLRWFFIDGVAARFSGTGEINGSGNYDFTVTARDGEPDQIRIEITEAATGAVVYDSAVTGSQTPLGGGSITIHSN